MFAKTLVKLIDYAIFPAVLIVTAKVTGSIFLTKYFGSHYLVDGIQLAFSNADDFVAINSYSSVFMFTAVIAGLVWVVIKAHVFHDSHITPALSAKIFNMNLEELIHDNQTIFSQAFIWLSYAWLTTIMFGVQAYFGLSYGWVFWLGLGISVVATALLVIDMEREIIIDKIKIENPQRPEKIVTFGELAEEILAV